jgi:DNA methylase
VTRRVNGDVRAPDEPVQYHEFLRAKAQLATAAGLLDVRAEDVNPILKPHQRDAVVWAVRGGRRALFESFGLGKTLQQLEIERIVLERLGGGRGLIVCPLGVRQEFTRDARLLDLEPRFVRSEDEASGDGIYLTNYETVREGKLDPRAFDVVSLDEAAVLRGFGGTKTFREFMALYEGTANYRFVATATPSPNDYIELLAYAAFLDILDVGQAKTRFFKRDSEHADALTLLPHMEHEFWMWVASWALFLQRPSDLGYSDEGYELPPIDVVWHQVPAAAPAEHKYDRDGRGPLFRDASMGVQAAAAEKRESIPARVAKMREILDEAPDEHFLLWHDLEAERRAIAAAVPAAVSVWGSQDLDEREQAIIDFSDGRISHLSTKPVIAGSGCNFQRHCSRAIFTGIGFKFADFIQAIHRVQRFQQTRPVRIDLIYTEAEAEIRKRLEEKWGNHERLVERMTEIIREHGLSHEAIDGGLRRSVGVERQELAGDTYRAVLNDSVIETRAMDSDSVGLIVTSIPFSTQYEYSPSFNDFGHNADNATFWAQMDYLTPELVRVLQPGRVAAIHVKDRIVPSGLNGLGFRTLHPFHAEAIEHYTRHGLGLLGMITVVTDVVRENNQTYRLGYEQCKDGSPMGVGVPEYVLLLRKPPTDPSNGYADDPIVKDKAEYSLGRWQVDAHGFWRSDGDRHLGPEDLAGLTHPEMFRLFRDHNLAHVYSSEDHVALGDHLREDGKLPVDFMLLQPPSWHPDVWTDVARMRTLNMIQAQKGKEQHLCPLQFDIVDRLIVRYSNEGDTVFDPFAGIMTVPYCAMKLDRFGIGVELNAVYWRDGVAHLQAEDRKHAMPTLFDALEAEAA